MSTTSLQLVMAYGALANGGELLEPALVHEVRSTEGTEWRFQPRSIRRVIDEATAREVSGVLQAVVDEGGTGTEASLATLKVAGKTGTARIAGSGGYGDRRYAASFVGYTPVDRPQLVIMAKLEDPKGSVYGGLTAAPVMRTVVQAILATRGRGLIESETRPMSRVRLDWDARRAEAAPSPYRFADARQVTQPGSADHERLLPDVTGLETRIAVSRLHALGLRVELQATGRVSRQEPSAGTRVVRGATILLR
jgi:cell division protein FtsI (penicillin-binding protein 3)